MFKKQVIARNTLLSSEKQYKTRKQSYVKSSHNLRFKKKTQFRSILQLKHKFDYFQPKINHQRVMC